MKNKKVNLVLATVVALIAMSFTTKEKIRKEIKIEKSKIVWKAYKVTGSHIGLINLKEGLFIFEDKKLTGGSFIIDMSSITNTDQKGEYKQKLENHLKSNDFFGVNTYPTATLTFKKVDPKGKNSYEVSGVLTIRGITKPVNFDISVYGNKATASLKIDRAKYNVRFGSNSFFDNLKDKAIYDEFDLIVDLEF
jgi:polyisoprenoid-binding protein YceI